MRDLLALHVEVGQYAALTALDAVGAPEARGLRPEVAGMHGQTVFHDPQGKRSGVALSIQIGEPTAVARALDCSVVSNFRMADVLEGGEGAPLVPRFDLHQFVSDVSDRVLLNLGGIANITRLKPNAQVEEIVAFDCGSGNMLLDAIMGSLGPQGSRYDDQGQEAARGRADEEVVKEFLADPFIARRPPKSAGREEFGAAYLERFLSRTGGLSLADRLRTAVEITAGAVARGGALSGHGKPAEALVSGGGGTNREPPRAAGAAPAGPEGGPPAARRRPAGAGAGAPAGGDGRGSASARAPRAGVAFPQIDPDRPGRRRAARQGLGLHRLDPADPRGEDGPRRSSGGPDHDPRPGSGGV